MKAIFIAMLALLFIGTSFASDDVEARGQVDVKDCKVVANEAAGDPIDVSESSIDDDGSISVEIR